MIRAAFVMLAGGLLFGSAGSAEAFVVTPDGRAVVTGAGSKDIKLWDAEKGTQLWSVAVEDEIESASFTPDGKLLIVRTYSAIHVLDGVGGKALWKGIHAVLVRG